MVVALVILGSVQLCCVLTQLSCVGKNPSGLMETVRICSLLGLDQVGCSYGRSVVETGKGSKCIGSFSL